MHFIAASPWSRIGCFRQKRLIAAAILIIKDFLKVNVAKKQRKVTYFEAKLFKNIGILCQILFDIKSNQIKAIYIFVPIRFVFGKSQIISYL